MNAQHILCGAVIVIAIIGLLYWLYQSGYLPFEGLSFHHSLFCPTGHRLIRGDCVRCKYFHGHPVCGR